MAKGKDEGVTHKDEKPYPLPEALGGDRGRDWKIKTAWKPGHGRTDSVQKIMTVPMGDDPKQANVRIHEMAHAAWSISDPETLAKKWGISDPRTVAACEDARMTYALNAIGAGTMKQDGLSPDGEEKAIVEGLVRAYDAGETAVTRRLLAQAVTAFTGTAHDKPFADEIKRSSLPQDLKDLADMVSMYAFDYMNSYARRNGTSVPPLDATMDLARWVEGSLTAHETAEKAAEKAMRGRMSGGDEEGESRPMRMRSKDGDDEWNEEEAKDEYGTCKIPMSAYDNDKNPMWGKLHIEHPPLEYVASIRIKARRRKNDECGVDVRSLDRIHVDGRVFGVRKRVPGGTVLIDNSGSMDFTAEQVREIMELAPAATIAFYEGCEDMGRLVIAAQRGKIMATEGMQRKWGGNVVDGPALVWLASQAAPRYWVSDEGVSGVGDACGGGLVAYCRVVCARAHIKRLDGMPEVIEEFKGLVVV